MPYCVNCGVELDEKAERCPLCLTPLPRASAKENHPGRAFAALDPEDADKLTATEGLTIVWELLSVSLAIGAAVVLVIDLLESPGLSWSGYPLASIALAWILITALLGKRIPRPLRIAAAAAAPFAYFLALDALDGRLDWSLRVAGPICLAAELAAAALAFAVSRSRRRGANVAAILLADAAAFCVALESILDLSRGGSVSLGWSAIVLTALLPISLFLFYLHYRILGTARLRRFFHL